MDARPDVLPDSRNNGAGFRVAVSRQEIPLAAKGRLRLFGVSKDNAVYELDIYPPVVPQIELLFGSRFDGE